MKHLFAALLFVLSIPTVAAERTLDLSVPDMSCATCPVTIKHVLNKIDGVDVVSASLETKRVSARIQDGVKDETVLEAIREAGFTPSVEETKKQPGE